MGDVKEHYASRLFNIKNNAISWVDLNNHDNYSNCIITWPINQKYAVDATQQYPVNKSICISFSVYNSDHYALYGDDVLLIKGNSSTIHHQHCLSYTPLKIQCRVNAHQHTVYTATNQNNKHNQPLIESVMYYLFSVHYADGFINLFYGYYVIQCILILWILLTKTYNSSSNGKWWCITALKYTYSKVWIIFVTTAIAFITMPIFYGSFAKDNNRCSVFEAPFYPFGTRYNNEDVFQFDFLIWITLFMYYENALLFVGYHVYLHRHLIKNKWIPVMLPGLICYVKYRMLYNMFTWYVYEDSSCFDTDWLYYIWNGFGFMQLVVMPVSWIFLRYIYLIATNKVTLGFRPKDL